jgi:CRISPR-associated protein Cst2
MLPLSEGLHPDRGPIGIRVAARLLNADASLSNENLHASIRKAIASCAVLDVGGYLAAWQDQQGDYVAEQAYIQSACAELQRSGNRVAVEVVKRESCFDVGWLISEAPQDLTVTQHSAFRDTPEMNSRYAQTMRSNIYGGVIRADLHRIGTDDYWYLQLEDKNGEKKSKERLAVTPDQQKARQKALVQAIVNFIASPTGAKVAGWAPHVFLAEGAILLTSSRTAPFASPIKVDLNDADRPVQPDSTYVSKMEKLKNERDTWVWSFTDAQGLLTAATKITSKLDGQSNG